LSVHWILVFLILTIPAGGAALVWRSRRARRLEIAELASRLAGRFESPAARVGPSLYAHIGQESLALVADVDFVLVLVEQKDMADYARTCKQVLDLALAGGALLVANLGGLIHLALDTNTGGDERAGRRRKVVNALSASLGERVRLVHGRCDSLVGTVGNDQRKSWVIVPGAMALILQMLIYAGPGEVISWDGSNSEKSAGL
jgi:hypothetical protein